MGSVNPDVHVPWCYHNMTVNLFGRIWAYELTEKEKNHRRQLIMPLELLLPFALVDSGRLLSAPPPHPPLLPSLAKVSHHLLRMLPNICVRVCAPLRRGLGVLIPPLWVSPLTAFFFFPSFPTSHLRLARLCWAKVSQSSAEGQTDFTVVGKRVMCLTGAGGLHS